MNDQKQESPDLELSWQTFLGNQAQSPLPALDFTIARSAFISAWYASRAYSAAHTRAHGTSNERTLADAITMIRILVAHGHEPMPSDLLARASNFLARFPFETSGDAPIRVLRAALARIAKWEGEFPGTGRKWADGSPVSYFAAFGSNGERDYMRQLARVALEQTQFETSRDAEDAARYRFLREPGNSIVYAKDRSAWGEGVSGHVKWSTPEALDAAIDTARRAEKSSCESSGKIPKEPQ